MFIKRMVFILAVIIAAVPAFGAVERIINANARDRIADEYIVIFQRTATDESIKAIEDGITSRGGTILFRYRAVLRADAVKLPAPKGPSRAPIKDPAKEPNPLKFVMASGIVASIEANLRTVSTATIQSQPTSSLKGLDRIDQRLLGLNGKFQYTETGEGVDAYVIDSGILKDHEEFTGRRLPGYSAFGDHTDTTDCNGHGTHVAGTIGGTTYGVAKKVTLIPVRVLDCGGYGSEATILAGVEWVMLDVRANKRPAVANLSLRLTGPSPALENAIQKSIDEKITYVVAAGNLLGEDACKYSPAHLEPAITVGSVDPTNDRRSVLSATGICIDLFAPGVRILSATVSKDRKDASEIMSGTSMAAAHVSGVVALYLQSHTDAMPSQVRAAIGRSDNVSNTPGWSGIDNRGRCSPNEMLHWGPRDDGFNDSQLTIDRRVH